MKRIITYNAIKCKKCGDIIESKHVHDYVTCKCGAVSVDGGHEYLRRRYPGDTHYKDYIEDLSITKFIDENITENNDVNDYIYYDKTNKNG